MYWCFVRIGYHYEFYMQISNYKNNISYISSDNEFTGGRFKLNVATFPSIEVSTNPFEVENKRRGDAFLLGLTWLLELIFFCTNLLWKWCNIITKMNEIFHKKRCKQTKSWKLFTVYVHISFGLMIDWWCCCCVLFVIDGQASKKHHQ